MQNLAERVIIERKGAVAHVRLSRPEKRNGLDRPMFEAIREAGRALATDTSVRSVVLSGDGPTFCAGLDFKAMMSAGPAAIPALLARPEGDEANLAQSVAWVWRELPVPVVCAIHGAAYGGGLQIALGADIRYATPDAKLSVMEMRYGIIPDMGASKTLLELIPPDIARELTYTARVFDAKEGLSLGLVTALHDDPLAAAWQTAEAIAAQNPDAIRAAKRLYREAPRLSSAESLKLESELQIPLLGSANQLEAVQAAMMKRPAQFQDPASESEKLEP